MELKLEDYLYLVRIFLLFTMHSFHEFGEFILQVHRNTGMVSFVRMAFLF